MEPAMNNPKKLSRRDFLEKGARYLLLGSLLGLLAASIFKKANACEGGEKKPSLYKCGGCELNDSCDRAFGQL